MLTLRQQLDLNKEINSFLNPFLKLLQAKIKENPEEFINLLTKKIEAYRYDISIDDAIAQILGISISKTLKDNFKGRIIDTLLFAHALELDSKEIKPVFVKNTLSTLVNSPFDRDKLNITNGVTFGRFKGKNTAIHNLVAPNLNAKQGKHLEKIFNNHYPDLLFAIKVGDGEVAFFGCPILKLLCLSILKINELTKIEYQRTAISDQAFISELSNQSELRRYKLQHIMPKNFCPTLPTELNKKRIPVDQLIFMGDQKGNSVIGAGAIGSIFAEKLNEENVVVKFYILYESYNFFLQEALAINHFKSPYVINGKGFVYHPTAGFGIVMKRYALSLEDFLKEEVSLEQQLKWAWQICAGVADIHKSEWLHNDLASRNIYLDEQLNAVVADLGAAKNQSDSIFQSVCPWFAAPELLIDKENTIPSDIYALGVTLWQLSTGGKIPFEGMMGKDVIKAKTSYHHETIPAKAPEIFKTWISACLNDDPAKRPTAETLRDAFKSAYDALLANKADSGEEKTIVSTLSIFKKSSLSALPQELASPKTMRCDLP